MFSFGRIFSWFLTSLFLFCVVSFSGAVGDEPAFLRLFDGETLYGWEHRGNWKVVDGAVYRADRGGDLVFKIIRIPDDFELRFEWKVAEGSNSGVYYRPGQYEYQILDNAKHPDGKNPRTSAASLYFCMAPSHDATRPVGQWNEGRIVCKGTVIQHWLNGEKVIDFDYKDPRYQFNVELLRARGGNVEDRGAYLRLQDHGDEVWYRNILLREIPEEEQLERAEVVPAEIPPDVLAAERKKLEAILARRGQTLPPQLSSPAAPPLRPGVPPRPKGPPSLGGGN